MAVNGYNRIRKYALLGGVLLFLPLLGLLFFGVFMDHNFNTLPYFTAEGPVEGKSAEAQRVGEFLLTNHQGLPYASDSLEGKVWLAAFFSTEGPHAAAITRSLLWPNFRYRDEDDVSIVCFTLEAEHDTPPVLGEYVERNTRYNGFAGKWQFLTGEQAVIDSLIARDFMIQRDPAEPDNIATVWLVDGEGYLRGVYHAASENDLRDAVEDVALLQKEMDEAAYAARKGREAARQAPPLPVLGEPGHTVPAFALTSQDGREFSHRDVGDRVRVVDFFFTTCPSICPVMSSQLSRLQPMLRARGITDREVLFLSHTVDPTRDTPEVLKAYGERLGADFRGWTFLTGPDSIIYDLARNGYLATALPSDTAAGGFFHSDTFTLVDRQGRIRGSYDGTSTQEVNLLADHIVQLLAEEPQ